MDDELLKVNISITFIERLPDSFEDQTLKKLETANPIFVSKGSITQRQHLVKHSHYLLNTRLGGWLNDDSGKRIKSPTTHRR